MAYLKSILMFNSICLFALCKSQCEDYYLFFQMDQTSVDVLSRESVWKRMESEPNSTSFRGIDKNCIVSLKYNEGLSIINCSKKRQIKIDNVNGTMTTYTESNSFIRNVTDHNKELEVTTNTVVIDSVDPNNFEDNVTTVDSDLTSSNDDFATEAGTELTTSNMIDTALTETATPEMVLLTKTEIPMNKTIKKSDQKEDAVTGEQSRKNKGSGTNYILVGVVGLSTALVSSAFVFFAVKKLILCMQSGTYILPDQ